MKSKEPVKCPKCGVDGKPEKGVMKRLLMFSAFLILFLTGCQDKIQNKQDTELHDARMKWITESRQHRPLDKKVPLLAIKYGVSENVVREFVATYDIEEQSFDKIFLKALTITNIVEFRDMEVRLANLPPISNTVTKLAGKHCVKPEVIASLLVDYYSQVYTLSQPPWVD